MGTWRRGASSSGSAVVLMLVFLSVAVSVCYARELTESLTTPETPSQLDVPSGVELKIVLSAKGYQYYKFNGSSWVNNNASARLYNSKKKEVARHYFLPHVDSHGGQPTWETLSSSSGDSFSRVTCKATVKVIEGADNIAWVLLQATESSGDKDYFGKVTYVQRYNTYHGLPPAKTAGVREGHVTKSSYTASYAFYVPKSQ